MGLAPVKNRMIFLLVISVAERVFGECCEDVWLYIIVTCVGLRNMSIE